MGMAERLAEIEGPTAEVAELYAQMLAEAGLEMTTEVRLVLYTPCLTKQTIKLWAMHAVCRLTCIPGIALMS